MKILKRLRDLKVMEDTLEGLEARKSLNRKAAYVSLTFAILVTLLSASYMNTWVYFFSMFTPAATIGMRGMAAVSLLLFISKACIQGRSVLNLIGKDPPLAFLRQLIRALISNAFLEMFLASYFSFVVFPHQATDVSMSKHYDSSSLMQRWYWYIIPSLYAKFFYLRMTADFLTFSFVDSFIKESLNKEARMRELMNEETIRSPSMNSLDSTIPEDDDGLFITVLPAIEEHNQLIDATGRECMRQLAKRAAATDSSSESPEVVKDLFVMPISSKDQGVTTGRTESKILPERTEKDAPAATHKPISDESLVQAVHSSAITAPVRPTSSPTEPAALPSLTLPLSETGGSNSAAEKTASLPVAWMSILDPAADPIPLMAASPPVPVSSVLNQAAEIIPLSSDARTPSTDISSVSKSSETLLAGAVDESKTLTETSATDPDKTSDAPSLPSSCLPQDVDDQQREEKGGRIRSLEEK